MRRRGAVGAAVATVALLLGTGPAPGETGGCGDDVERADAKQFCIDRGAWECARRRARGEFDSVEQEMACVAEAQSSCQAVFGWPLDCQPAPTRRETRACIDALKKRANLERTVAEIGACQLCGAPPPPPAPDAGPAPEDAGPGDAGADDAGPALEDAGADDAGAGDAGVSPEDAGADDAGGDDAGASADGGGA